MQTTKQEVASLLERLPEGSSLEDVHTISMLSRKYIADWSVRKPRVRHLKHRLENIWVNG
jgi:hypothetical protein